MSNSFKVILSAALAGAAAYFEVLALPVMVLCFAMLADYITGIVGAFIQKKLSSRLGIFGIIKKLCYMLAVICGIIVDYVCNCAANGIGLSVSGVTFFGTLVTVWLILNEVISTLENLSEIGVPMPSFLLCVAQHLKSSIEESEHIDKKE